MSESIKAILDGMPRDKTGKHKNFYTAEEIATAMDVPHRSFEKWRGQKRQDGTQKGPPFLNLEGNIRYPRKGFELYLVDRAKAQEDKDQESIA